MVADAPLYALMQHALHDAPEGERNPEYSRIITLPGHMHQAIAYQDIIKFISWDSGLDCLAHGGGLSPSLIDVFRKKKDYKTTLRLFRQCAVTWMLRIIDVLFDDGDLFGRLS